jgi:hypothetical protein
MLRLENNPRTKIILTKRIDHYSGIKRLILRFFLDNIEGYKVGKRTIECLC